MPVRFIDAVRGTGRTTRALQWALSQAHEGKVVLFCTADHFAATRAFRMARQFEPSLRANVTARTVYTDTEKGSVTFSGKDSPLIKLRMGRSVIPDLEVVADHYAIERDFEWPLDQWTRDLVIPMVLYCPECGMQHVDAKEWAYRPHRTHLCHGCSHLFRPAHVSTVGVLELLPVDVFLGEQGHVEEPPVAKQHGLRRI